MGHHRIVALLAEGVDRNLKGFHPFTPVFRSPSLRRAWIEIRTLSVSPMRRFVALLAEGVDRNCFMVKKLVSDGLSPSLRRAWIEM